MERTMDMVRSNDVSVCQGEIDTEKYIELIEPIYNPPSDNSIKYIEEKLKLIQKASNLINIHCLFSDLQNIRSTILQPLSTGLHKLIIIILFDGQHWLTIVNYKSARHFTVFDRHFTGFSRRLICMLSRAVNFTCYTHYRVELLPVKQCPIDEKTDIYFAFPYAVLALKLYADKNKNKTDVANIEFNIQQLTDYFDNSFNKLIIGRLPFDIVSHTANVPLCKRIFYTIYLRCLCKRPIILDNPPYYVCKIDNCNVRVHYDCKERHDGTYHCKRIWESKTSSEPMDYEKSNSLIKEDQNQSINSAKSMNNHNNNNQTIMLKNKTVIDPNISTSSATASVTTNVTPTPNS
ncbi:unnamed protein product, partial [Didymodactylos carnosus]